MVDLNIFTVKLGKLQEANGDRREEAVPGTPAVCTWVVSKRRTRHLCLRSTLRAGYPRGAACACFIMILV